MFRPGWLRSIARWGADGRYAKTTSSCRRRRSPKCAPEPIGASCCRRSVNPSRRPRHCRARSMSAPRFGRRNGEGEVKIFAAISALRPPRSGAAVNGSHGPRKSPFVLGAVLLALVALAGWGAARLRIGWPLATATAAEPRIPPARPPHGSVVPAQATTLSAPVPVVLPRLQSVTNYVVITGNAAAVNAVKLVARVEGYLEDLHYQDGAFVKKGDLLFTVQQDPYKEQL